MIKIPSARTHLTKCMEKPSSEDECGPKMPWWWWMLCLCGLCIATFGFWLSVIPPLLLLSFLLGGISYLYGKSKQPLNTFYGGIVSDIAIKPGIRKLLEDDFCGKTPKFDQRLTGSCAIDQCLQDIISLLIRDFVTPWYQRISADEDFENATRESLQKLVINISARMKEVEWITYLTTRLVDDAASHLQLYRLACEKIKAEVVKKVTPQSLASFKSATEGSHSRNNSDGCAKIKTHSRNSSISDKPTDIETAFFRIEAEQSSRRCYEQLCTNREAEKRYFNDIVDTALFLVLPVEDFSCLPARQLLREIVIGGLLIPLVDMLADPDFVNRSIVSLCSDFGITSEAFLTTLRVTTDKNELSAIQDFVSKELMYLRSRDGGNEADLVKQQINSLMYIKKSIDHKLQCGGQLDKIIPPDKFIQLSLTAILTNSLALSYFIDYLSPDAQNYIFLHLAIESWKSSLIKERQKNDNKMTKSQISGLRESAVGIYQQFIPEEAVNRVRVDEAMAAQLLVRIVQDTPQETIFDDLQSVIFKKLTEKLLPDFYKSSIYLKLLSDLELLKDDEGSPDNLSLTGSIEDEELSSSKAEASVAEHQVPEKKLPECGEGRFQLKVDIIDSGVVQDKSKMYGIYALSVLKSYENGFSKQWHVYRRYSDFYDLQQKIKDYYSDLGKLPFPGKKTFNNMGALTLAKRMRMLNDYLQILLHSGVAETHSRLPGLLLSFLEPAEYDKSLTLGSALESVVTPFKSSMRSVSAVVRTVPEILNVVDNISMKKKENRDENVPVRILLLLMDEVFDLQSRNQWLRRRIVVLLRQVFGDLLTRKMLDYVEELTGAPRVAGYIASIKEMLWPNEERAEPVERDASCRLRTRILAKGALLTAADDFKHLLGSETTRRGLLRVFDTFQHPSINRRLVYVLFEGISELVFPAFADIYTKLSLTRKK